VTGVIEWGRERARTGPWRGDAHTAYLAPAPESPPPSPVFLRRCLDELTHRGFDRVVTGALSPPEQRPFLAVGFAEQERLHLLAHDLRDLPSPPGDVDLRRGHRSDRGQVLAVDVAAFQPFWQLDDTGLEEALAATPSSRFRVASSDTPVDRACGNLVGYAISGRAARQGYLQRLAVHPACQRAGIGTALVLDGLQWMRRRGVTRAVVNTQLDNEPALALYRHLGFRLQTAGLAVLSRPLPA
jgi:ribosomal protein S18 acetylase RimI-like enzyme